MLRQHRFRFNKLINHSKETIKYHNRASNQNQHITQNIDKQLHQAYHQQPLKSRSALHRHYLQSIRLQQNEHLEGNQHKTPPIKQYKQTSKGQQGGLTNGKDLVLINNKDVMKYIQYIYSHYHIQDPQISQKTSSPIVKNELNFTNKKLADYGVEETIDSARNINSARTTKPQESMDKIYVSPFRDHDDHENHHLSQHTSRKVIVLRSASKKVKQREEKVKQIYRGNSQQNRSFDVKYNVDGRQKISSSFRYCFMCEQPILQSNISYHEEECAPLKTAYSYTLKQLIKILDRKILKFIQQLKNIFIDINSQSILRQHQHNQQLITPWINEILASLNYNPKQPIFDYSPLKTSFQAIQRTLIAKQVLKLQHLNKLNWFVRLKSNIEIKYYNCQ